MKMKKGYMERAVQLLYPMELRCNVPNAKTELNPQVVTEFHPIGNADAVSNLKTYEQLEREGSEPLVEH